MPVQMYCTQEYVYPLITTLPHWNACCEVGSHKIREKLSLNKHNVIRNQSQFSIMTDFPSAFIIFEVDIRVAKVTC